MLPIAKRESSVANAHFCPSKIRPQKIRGCRQTIANTAPALKNYSIDLRLIIPKKQPQGTRPKIAATWC